MTARSHTRLKRKRRQRELMRQRKREQPAEPSPPTVVRKRHYEEIFHGIEDDSLKRWER